MNTPSLYPLFLYLSAVGADRRAPAGDAASRLRREGGVGRAALAHVPAAALLLLLFAVVPVVIFALVGKVGRGARGSRSRGGRERGRRYQGARVQRVPRRERGLDDGAQPEQLALELAVFDLEALDEERLAGAGALGGLAAALLDALDLGLDLLGGLLVCGWRGVGGEDEERAGSGR